MDARWMREEPQSLRARSSHRPPSNAHGLRRPRGPIAPNTRRALRRSLRVECELASSRWPEPVLYRTSDVSPYGMWLETVSPLDPGSELLAAFPLPRSQRKLVLFARVTRRNAAGMALEFFEMTNSERTLLEQSLRGIPPRLVRRAA